VRPILQGHPARLFAASGWEVLANGTEAGDLVLTVDGDEWVAQIGARLWDSVCAAEAILPADLYARWGKKLAIALDALRAIGDRFTSDALDADLCRALDADLCRALDKIAANALSDIAELDL